MQKRDENIVHHRNYFGFFLSSVARSPWCERLVYKATAKSQVHIYHKNWNDSHDACAEKFKFVFIEIFKFVAVSEPTAPPIYNQNDATRTGEKKVQINWNSCFSIQMIRKPTNQRARMGFEIWLINPFDKLCDKYSRWRRRRRSPQDSASHFVHMTKVVFDIAKCTY